MNVMNINYKWFFCILLAVLLNSCTDELKPENNRKGASIGFELSSIDTRTVYGNQNSDNSIPIWWVDGDEINIFCEQAESNQKAQYTVQSKEGGTNSATLRPETGQGLAWGGHDNTHYFYGVYPASNRIDVNDGIANFPLGDQICTYEYSTVFPDMSNAYMVSSYSTRPNDEKIAMTFWPIMTTLKVTIQGRSNASVKVRGLTIKNDNFAKDFYYNINAENKDAAFMPNSSSAPIDINVRIKNMEADRYTDYVEIGSNESITLFAFLPPIQIDKENPISIQVLGANNDDVLTISELIPARDFATMTLPTLRGERETPANNDGWVSQLDQSLKIKSLSIPGSHESAAYSGSGIPSSYITQGVSMEDQWSYGVRCFEFTTAVCSSGEYIEAEDGDGNPNKTSSDSSVPWTANGSPYIDGTHLNNTELYLYAQDENYMTLRDAINKIHLKVSPTKEFAIIVLHKDGVEINDYINEGRWQYKDEHIVKIKEYINFFGNRIPIDVDYKYYKKRSREVSYKKKLVDDDSFNSAMQRLIAEFPNGTFVEWNPELTIKDCQGKIILMSDYDNGNWNYCAFSKEWSKAAVDANEKGMLQNHRYNVTVGNTTYSDVLYVQNYMQYQAANATYKSTSVALTLDFAAQNTNQESEPWENNYSPNWVINYVSGYKTSHVNWWFISFDQTENVTNAQSMNTLLIEKLSSGTLMTGQAGIVVFDLAGISTYRYGSGWGASTYNIGGHRALEALISHNKKIKTIPEN